jgi:hypothetical protein
MKDQLEDHIEIKIESQPKYTNEDYQHDEVPNLDLSIYDDNLSVAYSVDDVQPLQVVQEDNLDDIDYFHEYILTPINYFFITVINFIYAL